MECIVKELGIPRNNIFPNDSTNLFTLVVHSSWLKQWLQNKQVSNDVNIVNFHLQVGESVTYPWKKIFVRVLSKKVCKVLPLPRYKLNNGTTESVLTFSQLLQYVSQTNQRNLWKESYKKYSHNSENNRESAIVNLMEHDQLLSEVILRLYGCNIIRIKSDSSYQFTEYLETIPNKYVSKSYETHANILSAMFTLETDNNFFVFYNGHYENNLLDCLNFSPALIDANYASGLFLVYQLLQTSKAMCDRGLSLGDLTLEDIYLSENLWLQIVPSIKNHVHTLDASLVQETRCKQSGFSPPYARKGCSSKEEVWWRGEAVQLERLCALWVRGRISNLDYLLHLNSLAGRRAGDPQAHYVIPWVTDFTSRCGTHWRDLTKSKYRLTKGDRQLDMTYDVPSKESSASLDCPSQTPHHVSDVLSDITYYVYLARRTPKEVLCKYVRNNWVPAEYPISIQRMQEWTPDECIPEFYTDPSVFKSVHEDLPDLEIPSWATCAEDFVTKHREALESAHVSENLHHWIDLTFGFKLTGPASVKAKNVCLSLVDGHRRVRRGAAVQLLTAAHPARVPRAAPPAPPRLHWTRERRKILKSLESSDEISDEEDDDSNRPQHVSRLCIPTQHSHSSHKSNSRTRSLSKSKSQDADSTVSPRPTEPRNSSRHYRVQRSELGKGVIYLPKDYNPVSLLQALESLDHFNTKCFMSKTDDVEDSSKGIANFLNLSSLPQEKNHVSTSHKADIHSDENSFTNHMFLATYEQSYLKRLNQDVHLENVMKERKNRVFNNRYTTDAAVYKQFLTESRRQDMLVIGCLIVEIFLHSFVRPLKTSNDTFINRYNCCRTVLQFNFNALPKCVSYVASLLLNVEPPSLSPKNELPALRAGSNEAESSSVFKKIVVTEKGLPLPTASQLLQPLLKSHLIPFPSHFTILYNLLMTLHEYELTSKELNILCMYECDGVQCTMYQNVDKTKIHFEKKIAEGKIQSCITHLDMFINKLQCFNQFDVMELFLPHYIELLENKETSILAAWYLFDVVSKALGPVESRKKLLKYILNLYDDDDLVTDKPDHHILTDLDSAAISPGTITNKKKSVKLYHNIFLLQLIVRLGLQCFLDHFTQHLVEAVGGYKDLNSNVGSPGHLCNNRLVPSKKPRYSDDTVKSALSTANDILSPDTSYGSENVMTPIIERITPSNSDKLIEASSDNPGEVDLFHFETDKQDQPSRSSRSKSPADSMDSYTLSANHPENHTATATPSPTMEVFSPQGPKDFVFQNSPGEKVTSPVKVDPPDVKLSIEYDKNNDSLEKGALSPTIPIPPAKNSMFTSYLHFAENDENSSSDEVEGKEKNQTNRQASKSLDLGNNLLSAPLPAASRSLNDEEVAQDNRVDTQNSVSEVCKISDMSAESLIWLAHRLGPVLTCRYITRNLLKMLTLCYIGNENLAPLELDGGGDEFDAFSIANGALVGDKNARKVITCLTSIVALYGEESILFQYLPHMRELIASCRRRLSVPLEGGVIACLQLLKYLVPYMTDVKLMEQLQDVLLKSILHPAVRLLSTTRGTFPGGARARSALTRKYLDALYALALRIGPEMTRRHLCVPALQRFFLAFDKATGKTENWPKTESETSSEVNKSLGSEREREGAEASSYLEICRDGSTAEWSVQDGRVVRADDADLACSPPPASHPPRTTAQAELLMVLTAELAHQAYVPFHRLVGADTMRRSLQNNDTIHALCREYDRTHATSPACKISHIGQNKRVQTSFSDDGLSRRSLDRNTETIKIGMDVHLGRTEPEHLASSNSFGSNVALVGNRIDIGSDYGEDLRCAIQNQALDVVSCKMDNGHRSNRHLRGDWLIYWEHEIGRPDKDNRFNLKQIKLQTFSGHAQSVKCIHCLDNENSFMSGSRDKCVKLWSLRNQGDGSAVSSCQWTYTGHRKGVLALTFLESQRLAVSTDSVVHLWDPFMETVVSQLDHIKVPISIVRTLPAPSSVVLAATTDSTLKLIDARSCNYTHDLKVTLSPNTFIRCMCVSPSGRWLGVGLASGQLALVDPRTGLLLAHWKAHDGEILQLVTINEHLIVSSSLDQTMMVWSTMDGKLKFHLKGSTEPVHCLSVYHSELVSGTTNNRVGVHTAVEPDASFSSTRLRTDSFRGVLTALAVLPLNRLLLLGSDNGTISLLC